jgi:hypothetical protein
LLRELRERTMLIGVRVGAAKQSLDTLRREQSRQGLNLRSDITASEHRANYFLDEAEAAVKSGEVEAAKKALDSAERQVQILEKFLGR